MRVPSSARLTGSTAVGPLAVLLIAAAVYSRTAYPTITWWDSSSYTLAAATIGIPSEPGSLLLTLLGWPVAQLSSGASTAYHLNLLAGAIAAATAMLIALAGLRLLELAHLWSGDHRAALARSIGVALGALAFAFANTPWEYAVQFTPYILSGLVTAGILLTLATWWRDADDPSAWRHLALLGILFGLDFSVHRTNALLIPGVVLWMLIRRPRTFMERRVIAAGLISLLAGLCVQLLIIPIARWSHSPLDFHDPSNLARFWDYITLKELGGGFLLQLYPRKSPLWSSQFADTLRVVIENFSPWRGRMSILGLCPGIAALLAWGWLWQFNRRLALAFAALLGTQIVATVLYFNIPAGYFRSFDRHYLPILVTIGVLVAMGVGMAVQWLTMLATSRTRRRVFIVAAPLLLAMAIAPLTQIIANWRTHDASNRYFARDWATNLLAPLPPNAVYFTVGDNDTFPVLYLQAVEGVRRDVRIINLPIASSASYRERIHRRDPSYPLSAAVTPLQLATSSAAQTPITYASTIGGTENDWPRDHVRLEGLYWRVVAERDPRPDVDATRRGLFGRFRGYADPSVVIDDVSRTMAFQYYEVARLLFAAESVRGDAARCEADLHALFERLPPKRLDMPADYREALESACDRR